MSITNKLVYIDGKWKVKNAEYIDYNVTFHHKHQGHHTPNYSGASASISPQFQPAHSFQPTPQPQTFTPQSRSASASVSPQFQPFTPQSRSVSPTVSPPFQLSSAFDPSSGEVNITNRRYFSARLEQLSEGKYLNVANMTKDGLGARIMHKSENMRITLIPGLDIGAVTLEQYGLALEMLVGEDYLDVDQAMHYYDQFMDVTGVTGERKDDLYDQFYDLIRPVMVKSAYKR